MNTVGESGNFFAGHSLIHQVFDSIGSNLYILNREKKIVFANKMLIKTLGLKHSSELLGKHPKELMLCEHIEEFPCEKDPVCGACEWDAENLEDQSPKEKVIYCNQNGFLTPVNMLQYYSAFEIRGHRYLVVTLEDITDTLRRRMLERLFFHDIINTAGALKGIIRLVKDEVPSEVRPDIKFVEDTFQFMIDEIQTQKNIADAENDELILYIDKSSTVELMKSVREIFLKHKVAAGKDVEIDQDSKVYEIQTDLSLLRRVLGNMLKNALEATEEGGFVSMGCAESEEQGQSVVFWVKNNQMIPVEIQKHIFQQQLSSKAEERGLGTYGIKLITEKYLNGTVGFTSSEYAGTTFFVRIPIFYKLSK